MKKRTVAIFLVLSLIIQLSIPYFAAAEPTGKENISNAVYLGIVDYGTVDKADKNNFVHRFSVNGNEVTYKVSSNNNYKLNNILAEGYVFNLVVENGVVTDVTIPTTSAVGTIQSVTPSGISATPSAITVNGKNITITETTQVYEIISKAGGAEVNPAALETGKTVKVYGSPADAVYITFVAEPYTAPLKGTPGQRTLKNFLATAMEPIGTSLYIFGGSWDWQDVGSSNQATTIGLSQTWIDFFQSKDENYAYRNNAKPAESYYPHKGYNQYYYAGVDCSGYVGWAMYNVMNSVNGNEGYVRSSTTMAKTFAQTYGYGTWTQTINASEFKPGDIFSMNGHVWICLGVCDDGSLVIMHSTTSESKAGQQGGGAQISAVGDEGSEAHKLAQKYMQKYFSAWSERYDAVARSYDYYTSFTGTNAGKFSWNLDETGLKDPDGYTNMSADEILKDLFNETEISNAVYKGVVDYGTVDKNDKDNFNHLFSVNGKDVVYKVSNKDNYAINNILAEGYVFDLVIENNVVTDVTIPEPSASGTVQSVSTNSVSINGQNIAITETTKIYEITSKAGGSEVKPAALEAGKTVKVYGSPADVVYITFIAEPYQAPVSGIPGQRTLKNFLATALEPVGTSLYIYGGAWDWQDVGSSNQATTIGLAQSWVDFFQSKDNTYTYKNNNNYAESYYPHKAYNQYYYAGVDCSGYVGWAMYNIMNTESGHTGYVQSSTSMAKTFAEKGFGTRTQTFNASDFKTGDIFSMNGHVWICLGVCDDGSLVIMHSTPSDSRTGNSGGGAQISGVGENENCQAYALAQEYMQRYFPEWSERYPAAFKKYSDYTKFTGTSAGKFSWNLDKTGVSDPDGYANMSAEEILKDLFGENSPETKKISNAVYLGVVGYGTVTAANKDNFEHRFSVNGNEDVYKVSNKDNYSINNVLAEGYMFDLVIEDGVVTDISIPEPSAIGTVQSFTSNSVNVNGQNIAITENTKVYEITSKAGGAEVKPAALETGKTVKVYGNPADVVYITFVTEPYTAPLKGVPGQRTLKNFLATALEPVGTSLYIYGGTWDWQDVGSSNQATTIGLAQSWVDFFQSKDENYTYRNNDNYAESYYPHKSYNQYYYAGVDCSGYVGWTMYNVMNSQSGNKGYVQSSTSMARTFAQSYGYGTWTQTINATEFKPGDIFSMNGHVWICLGVCDDGSLVIMHSTTSESKAGQPGGGAQISAVGDEGSEAHKLAQKYMQKYFSAWSERYDAVARPYSNYTKFTGTSAGKFSWNLDDTGLNDPDGYTNMSADEILKDLFGENSSSGGSGSSGGNVQANYTVTIKKTSNGSVTTNLKQAAKGANITLTVRADEGYALDKLIVTDSKGNIIKLSDLGNGKYSFTMPDSNVDVETLFKKIEESELPINLPFIDINENDWFYNALKYVYGREIIKGVSEKSFNPAGTLTRGMIMQILYNLEENPALSIEDIDSSIEDVESNQWFADAIYWAKKQDLIKGYGNGLIGPEDSVTREQVAVFLYSYARFKGYDTSNTGDLSEYTDSSQISDWAQDAMAWAIGSGLINGRPGKVLAPVDTISRAEMVQIIYNFLNK